MSGGARIHPTALVEDGAVVGAGTAVWDHVHVRAGARVGRDCIIGGKSYLAAGVVVGDRVKINSFVYVCAGTVVEDGAMLAAGATFTNDRHPRATTPTLDALRPSVPDEATAGAVVRRGATVGARAVVGPGVEIGAFAMVGMGAVVTRDVAPFHLVAGNPARPIGAVCRCGRPVLRGAPDAWGATCTCTACGRRYAVAAGRVEEVPGA